MNKYAVDCYHYGATAGCDFPVSTFVCNKDKTPDLVRYYLDYFDKITISPIEESKGQSPQEINPQDYPWLYEDSEN